MLSPAWKPTPIGPNSGAKKITGQWKHECPVAKKNFFLPKGENIFGLKQSYCPHCKKTFKFIKKKKLVVRDGETKKKN